MNDQTTELHYGQPASDVSGEFDIHVGMQVRDQDGRTVGTVVDVEGFGATHVTEEAGTSAAHDVIQAKSATGFFKIAPGDASTRNVGELLTVPFHGVQSVSPSDGVVLKGTALAEAQAISRAQAPPAPDDADTADREVGEIRAETDTNVRREEEGTVAGSWIDRGILGSRDPEYTLGTEGSEETAYEEEMKS